MTAQALCVLAKAVSTQGRHAAAEVLFRRALSIFQRVVGAEDQRTASAMADLALLRLKQGDDGEASLLFAEALRIEQNVSPQSPHFAKVLLEYADVLRRQKQKRPADAMKKRAQLILDGFRRNNEIRTVDVTELK